MSRIELIAPCHFGLESVLKKEILDLGYEIDVEDGRITFRRRRRCSCKSKYVYPYSGTNHDQVRKLQGSNGF